MLREVINDAIARGERLKKDIVGQLLKSEALNELLGNKRFAETIVKVIQTKQEVSRSIHSRIQEALASMNVPSRSQIADYEKRVQTLERKISSLGRESVKKRAALGKNGSKRPKRAGRK